MIDSHCHLDWHGFDGERAEVLARAAARGVSALVLPAVDEGSWDRITALCSAEQAVACHPALGIHPVALPEIDPDDDEPLIRRLGARLRTDRPVAVGECGLDTTIDLQKAPLVRQEAILRAHLALARELDLPIILHARGPGCYARLAEVLQGERLPAGGVVHSYGGGAELLRRFLELPLFFGFAGPATYRRAPKIRAAISAVPEDRLLAETDAPDQTPEPHRPGRNEPAFVAEIIAGIAEARGAPAEHIAEVTAANARRLFLLNCSE